MDARCSMRAWLRCSALVVALALALAVPPNARASSPDAIRDAAARLVDEGEYRRAARLLEAIRIADPTDPTVYVHLATARAGMRQYRAAAGAVRTGIERARERGDSTSLKNLSEHQRLAAESFVDHARSVLTQPGLSGKSRLVQRMDSILVLPTRPESLLSDTTSFFPGGMKNLDSDGALECVRLATQMNPKAAKPFALVAFEYIHMEKWSDAQRVVGVGLKRVPGDRDLTRLKDWADRKLKGEFPY